MSSYLPPLRSTSDEIQRSCFPLSFIIRNPRMCFKLDARRGRRGEGFVPSGRHFFCSIKQVLWAPWIIRHYKHNGLSAREHLDRQVSIQSVCGTLLPAPRTTIWHKQKCAKRTFWDGRFQKRFAFDFAEQNKSADLSRVCLNFLSIDVSISFPTEGHLGRDPKISFSIEFYSNNCKNVV